jgi:CHASE3 domain sensor protein
MRRTQAHDAADFDLGRGVNRLPVGIQVVLAAAGLLVLVVASPVAAILVVTRLNHSEIVLNARDAAYGQAVSAIALTATTIGNAERSYLATGDPALIAQTDRQIDRAHALFSTASDAATNAAERTALGDGRASFERWVLAVRHDLSAYRAGQRQQAQIDAQGQTLALRDAFDESTIHAQTLCAASIQAGGCRQDRAAILEIRHHPARCLAHCFGRGQHHRGLADPVIDSADLQNPGPLPPTSAAITTD